MNQNLLSINKVDEPNLKVYQSNELRNRTVNKSLNYDKMKNNQVFNMELDDTKFPILTMLAIFLVLIFIINKFYKFKSKKRNRRSLYYLNDFQRINIDSKRSASKNSTLSVTKVIKYLE